MPPTKKELISRKKADELQIPWAGFSRDELYAQLKAIGYVWKPKVQAWRYLPDDPSLTGSLYTDPDGSPSNLVKLRLIAHQDSIEEVTRQIIGLMTVTGYRLTSVSTPYPNRSGPTNRQYIHAFYPDHPWSMIIINDGHVQWRTYCNAAEFISAISMLTFAAPHTFVMLPLDDISIAVFSTDHAPWEIDETFIRDLQHQIG